MEKYTYPNFEPSEGYMTQVSRQKYITSAISRNLLPAEAHRMRNIVSLTASNDVSKPIQFWQLYSVLGQERIIRIIEGFYKRVFDDEKWFSDVFARVGGIQHHVNTQASMWIDAMGGGLIYHGGEFRLNFHHTHNAMQLMNDKGAVRWVKLMVETLDDSAIHMTSDPRVRTSLNTFLSYFFDKYAADFDFGSGLVFGETNPPLTRKVNFMSMTSDAIEALGETELRVALVGRGVDEKKYQDKKQLLNKALSM